ncbi:MAG: hypothetical protein BroJett025_08930 [Patescibacteria group bacterium]|nr:MAG: hypothetical protein BroJett025_08930 [Patescibacteria group bacterium]
MIFLYLAKPAHAVIGVTHTISTPANFNFRIDGASADHQLGYNGVSVKQKTYHDINNDGKLDLVIGATLTDYNSKANSGSVYIISGDILDNYAGTGNTIDLADSSNYSLRIDGRVAGGTLPASSGIIFADINNDGQDDMIMSESFADGTRGNVYILYSNLYSSFLNSTGNTMDLGIDTNYNLLLQGASTGDSFGNLSLSAVDLDNDSKKDILLEAHHDDNNSRGESGSVFIFFNSLLDDFSGTGNLLNVGTLSNFSVRIDGAAAGDTFGGGSTTAGDYDADGDIDLIIGSDLTDYNGSDTGSIWIIDNSKISSLAGTTGNLIDMATSTNWVVRMDGVNVGDRITYANSLIFEDINHDGLKDIVVGGYNADNNSRSNSGSLYLIDNSFFSSQTGSGNVLDIDGNFIARIDGALASDNFTFAALAVEDVNGNGRKDILAASRLSNTNGTDSGAVYVFFDSLIDTWSNGSLVDLATTTNFSIRYDGNTGDNLFFQNGYMADFNNDSQLDFIFNARTADYNSRTNSGSYYFFYNFPHTIGTPTAVNSENTTITINGDVTAPNSVTTIAQVQYSVDSNDPNSGNWHDCIAKDGAMDSLSEAFACTLDTENTGNHTIYIRAIDVDGFMTAQSHYKTVQYNFQPATTTCQDSISSAAPDLFQINTDVTSATVYFTPIGGVTDYFISFSTNQNAEEHGAAVTLSDSGVQSYTVDLLSPNTTYYFKVRGQSGCMPGSWSNIKEAKTQSTQSLPTISRIIPTVTPTPIPSVSPTPSPSASPGVEASPEPTETSNTPILSTLPKLVDSIRETINSENLPGTILGTIVTMAEGLKQLIALLGGGVAVFATTSVLTIVTVTTQVIRLGRKHIRDVFDNVLHALGFIQHNHPQGMVYDALTNDPIPFAVITITSTQNVANQRIQETVVTDVNGVYQDVHLLVGSFAMNVGHQDFNFPTKKQRPQFLTQKQFYKGEQFDVTSESSSQLFMVPMDKVIPASTMKKLGKSVKRSIDQINIINLFWPLFIFSVVSTALYPTTLNAAILGIQAVVVLKKSNTFLKKPTISGRIINTKNRPIQNAIIRVTDPQKSELIALTVSNKNGFYKVFAKPGIYQFEVIKQGYFWKKTTGQMSLELIDVTKESKTQNVTLSDISKIGPLV